MEGPAADKGIIPPAILAQIFPNGESQENKLIYCEKVKKHNRYNQAQDRILVLSSSAYWLVSSKKIHTKVDIGDLKYVVKALHSTECLF